MIKRYFKGKVSFWERLISWILIAGGALLVLSCIPKWAWLAIFGLFLIGLGLFVLMGRRWGR